MAAKISWQDEVFGRYYFSRAGWVDGTTEFWDLLGRYVQPAATVLEFGCGPANPTSQFLKSSFGRVDGLDIDERAKSNTYLDEVFIYDGELFPVADSRYDAIVADYVLEHLARPSLAMREIARVLRPGGAFLFRAPNLWHYVSVVSFLTPHAFHRRVANRLRVLPSDSVDPYPTHYRMNTRRRIRRLCRVAALTELELRMVEKEPSYGKSSRFLFVLFLLYERLVNRFSSLSDLRANIFGAYRK